MRELLPLAGDTVGMAFWINDNSQAVGASGSCANSELPPLAFGAHAVLWDADGTAHDLGNLGSTVLNMANSINNQGQVTGVSALNDQATPAQGHHAFLWTSATGMQDLGTLPGDVASVGTTINDAGAVVGISLDDQQNPSAYLWRDGVMSGLNDLAVNSPLYLLFASSINSSGEISGFGANEQGDVHGFLAIPTGGLSAREIAAAGMEATESRPRVRPRFRTTHGGFWRDWEELRWGAGEVGVRLMKVARPLLRRIGAAAKSREARLLPPRVGRHHRQHSCKHDSQICKAPPLRRQSTSD